MRDLTLTAVDNTGKVSFDIVDAEHVNGIELLAQRVLIILMTNINETLRDTEGSSFTRTYGNLNGSAEIIHLMLASGISDAVSAIMNDSDNDDDIELADVAVSDIQYSEDSVDFCITVYSKSGDNTQAQASIGVQ